jgi:hypothetical protein
MANFDDDSINLNDEDDWPELDFPAGAIQNQRTAVRYVREDIDASVCIISWLTFGLRIRKTITADLIDISSKGVLIGTDKKLRVNKKITLTLIFEDSKTFTISAKVARRSLTHPNQYGIKFDRFNHDLGDYLLETQKKLVFK